VLATVLNEAYDAEAAALADYLRLCAVPERLVELLRSPTAALHQLALVLVGNLASEAVDPEAQYTKAILKRRGAFGAVLPHLFSDDWTTLLYALGATQNLCTETQYVEELTAANGLERLQEILSMDDPQLAPFAQGCLDNVRQARVVHALQRRIEKRNGTAASVVQARVRNWKARHAVAKQQAASVVAASAAMG